MAAAITYISYCRNVKAEMNNSTVHGDASEDGWERIALSVATLAGMLILVSMTLSFVVSAQTAENEGPYHRSYQALVARRSEGARGLG